MADLVRRMSLLRGLDPRNFACAAFGGGGPLHAPAVAVQAAISRVVVPLPHAASVLSAYGAATSDVVHVVQRWRVVRLPVPGASVEEIFGERFKSLQTVEVNWLESTLFLNRGDHFEIRPLPMEAQLAPAFGVCVADFDGDGNEDIFLSQNFFASQPETPRSDAGRGLMLKGNGHGEFTAMTGQQSGLKVYGEQRGCAVADFDGDGRVDLVVAQNGAETKLYRNIGAKPGLRVRLVGSKGNLNSVGASLRLGSVAGFGPVREVHAGSGYWSQDGVVQIMNAAEPATKIWVRWPGGKEQTLAIPAGAREVIVDPSGKINASRH